MKKRVNPAGPPLGTARATRGAAFCDWIEAVASAFRGGASPRDRDKDIGLRIVVLKRSRKNEKAS